MTPRDVIKRAMRLHGALAGGAEPGPDDLTDYLLALNNMKRALFGTIIGTRLSAQAATGTACQAENGGEYQIPPVAYTLTAPLNPSSGGRFGVVDANSDFAAFPCIIARNGRLLEGAAANLTLSVNGGGRRWWFRGDTGNWIHEADYATANDVIEFPDSLVAYMPYMLAIVIAGETGSDLRQEVVAGAAEGRAAFARAYGRRGRLQLDPPLGVGQPGQAG